VTLDDSATRVELRLPRISQPSGAAAFGRPSVWLVAPLWVDQSRPVSWSALRQAVIEFEWPASGLSQPTRSARSGHPWRSASATSQCQTASHHQTGSACAALTWWLRLLARRAGAWWAGWRRARTVVGCSSYQNGKVEPLKRSSSRGLPCPNLHRACSLFGGARGLERCCATW